MFFFDNYYTFPELAKLAYSTLCTKLFYRKALLIRHPFYVRGKPRILFGYGFTTGYGCRFEVFGARDDKSKKLIIGENCKLGDRVHIAVQERIVIGDNCLMASNIFISDSNHGFYEGSSNDSMPTSAPNDRPFDVSPVHIGDNVWIGENVCILKGISIGNGVVIGANAVVTKDLPDNSIAVGSPARVIKHFDGVEHCWKRV